MVQMKTLLLKISFLFLTIISAASSLASETKTQELAQADELLSRQFMHMKGWTGADAAYSVPLSSKQTIWLFGDTFIGTVKEKKRINTVMINNTVALQDIGPPAGDLQFFWKKKNGKPDSIFQSDNRDHWFWPGDGAYLNARLVLFLHQIKRKPGDDSAWGFISDKDLIASVANPHSPPLEWKYTKSELPTGLTWGSAVLADGDWLYVYCEYPKAGKDFFKHPLILARIKKDLLLISNKTTWQYLCKKSSSDSDGIWKTNLEDPVILMQDGAPEMSVCRIRGKSGFYAIYFPGGLGPAIMLRHAEHPEGPWSAPQTIYKCPEDQKKIFVYSAKAHPELAEKDGELPITYCRNTESLQANFEHADIYVPRALRLKLD